MYRVKRMGPRTEPWGTPYFKGKDEEFMSPTETDCVLLVSYMNCLKTLPLIPNEYDNLLSKIL